MSNSRAKKEFRQIDDSDLDAINGGFLQFAPLLAAAGWAVASNPAAVVRGLTNGFQTAQNAYNAINNYLNPSPGNGAPGDTYHPATANPDGTINPGHFEAPQSNSGEIGPPQPHADASDGSGNSDTASADGDHSSDYASADDDHSSDYASNSDNASDYGGSSDYGGGSDYASADYGGDFGGGDGGGSDFA